MTEDATPLLSAERALERSTFTEYRKTALTRISDVTFPPGTVYATPEGLRAEDEDTRCAFDVQGGIYPIRESVFRASYELPALDAARPDAGPLREALERIVALEPRHYRRNGCASPDAWLRQRDVRRIARAALEAVPAPGIASQPDAALRRSAKDLLDWFDRPNTPSLGAEGDSLVIVLGAMLDDALAAVPAPGIDTPRLEAILPAVLAEADDAGSDADDWIGSEYVMRLAAGITTRLAPGIDVERLAKAFTVVQPGVYGEDWPRDDPDDFQFVNPRQHAEAIAAEYARLAQPGTPEQPGTIR